MKPATPPPRPKAPPSYRQRAGYGQAVVTLQDAATKRRRDYWLGAYGTPESRERYHRVVAEWESLGRRLPPPDPRAGRGTPRAAAGDAGGDGGDGPTVSEIVLAYWRACTAHLSEKRRNAVHATLRLLRRFDGSTPAAAFGPRKLRAVRDAMLRGAPGRCRRGWSRRTANDRARVVVAVFRWAASEELVPASVPQSLQTLAPIPRGHGGAREEQRVPPVDPAVVEATRPHVSRQVRALIDLQLLTGARPGELVGLRAADIDTTDPDGVWRYRPALHKTAHRGRSRAIMFGPGARRVLSEFMAGRPTDAPLFSPAEAEAERLAALHARRRTPLSCGNRPGTSRRRDPARSPGDRYTTDSYRRAIARACDAAFPPPERLRPRALPGGRRETAAEFEARLNPADRAELARWREEHRWHPHQLRHTAATRIRREFGLEAAQLVLGHASAALPDAVYAERDEARVVEVIRRVG